MQNAMTYQRDTIREPIGKVSEKNEAYVHYQLDSHIEMFNRRMEELKGRCLDPRENADEILNAITKAVIDISCICEEFEQAYAHDPRTIAEAQIEFREKTRRVLSQSYFVTRARTWPQGYPGDYKTLEDVYRNAPMSSGFGIYLDRYFLSTALGSGVRERLATLTRLLKQELTCRTRPKVLNIACGSCRELFEASPEVKLSGAMMTCIDFDSDALAYSANRMAYTGVPQEQMVFRKYNALRMVNHERNRREFGMQDIIYSTGFFDYVEDQALTQLLSASYQLLNPGGVLIASFKDCRRYRPQEYHWFVDWHGFLQRTEDDMNTLFDKAGIPRTAISSHREQSSIIKFFVITK